jgi:hypothetical protein
MAYIGKGFKDIATANIAVNTMVGDGSDTTLGLSMGSKGVGSVNDVSVFVSGIQQRPGTDFTLSGSTITFTTAPADGVKVVAMSHGDSWNNAPSDNTITSAKLKDASVTSDKIIGLDAGKLSGSLSGSGVNLTNLNAANISGTLPAIDGSALTGVSAYENETSDPTATSNKTLGTMWVNKTSGEMYILTDDTTNANVWTNVGDGTGDMPFAGMVATGGTITTDGDYKVHSFTTSSQFVVTTAGTTPQVEYLVIAGGGGAGNCTAGPAGGGGGGGAGGYRNSYNSETSGGGGASESALTVTATSYSITVGAGGAGAGTSGTNGTVGSDSIFSTITSDGGGYGGGATGGSTTGGAGGSGGGGANGIPIAGGSGTANQGYAGGSSSAGSKGGGGGGASEVGFDAASGTGAGDGGDGLSSSITGSAVYRAGGGGGGDWEFSRATGGNGGGGDGGGTGGSPTATAGTVNTGGGGGAAYSTGYGSSQTGGSGVVIIRYKFR